MLRCAGRSPRLTRYRETLAIVFGMLIITSSLIPGRSRRFLNSLVSYTSPLASVFRTRCLNGQPRPLQRTSTRAPAGASWMRM